MGHRHPEETRKPEGLTVRRDRFQRPAKHLRADIDAKDRLDCRPSVDRRRACRWRGEDFGKPPLGREFECCLKRGIDGIIGRGDDRHRVGGSDFRPTMGDRRAVMGQQGFFPDQADREEVPKGLVGSPAKLRLPEPIARVLPPAAKRGQKLVKIGRHRRRR